MKIIIFGGNGFIGKHLSKYLKQKKNFVKVFGNKKFSKSGVNLIDYNKKNFKNIIKKISPDVVIFLSGNSYPNNTLNDEMYDFKTNNNILQQLLAALAENKFKKLFIYTSSIAVYGSVKKNQFVNENFKLNPKSFYALSKIIAEKQIEYFTKNYNFKSIVLRLSSIYGPGLKRQVIYKILNQSLSSKSIKLFGNSKDQRQFLYIKDCIIMIEKLIKIRTWGFNLYNLSGGKKIKIIDIIKISIKLLKKNVVYKLNNKIKSPFLPALSNKKLLSKIGPIKFTNIKNGLKETLNWLNSSD